MIVFAIPILSGIGKGKGAWVRVDANGAGCIYLGQFPRIFVLLVPLFGVTRAISGFPVPFLPFPIVPFVPASQGH